MKQDNFLELTSITSALPIHSITEIVGIQITRHEKLSDFRMPQAHSNSALKISNNAFYRK